MNKWKIATGILVVALAYDSYVGMVPMDDYTQIIMNHLVKD